MPTPIEVKITPEMMEVAEREDPGHAYNGNSFLKGAGNKIGILGELVFQSLFPEAVRRSTRSYDFVLGDITVDVKTKGTTQTTPPRQSYESSVCIYSLHQDCSAYAFVRVNVEAGLAWVLGWTPRETLPFKSRYVEKGSVDPSNGFVAKQACLSLLHRDLLEMSELKEFRPISTARGEEHDL